MVGEPAQRERLVELISDGIGRKSRNGSGNPVAANAGCHYFFFFLDLELLFFVLGMPRLGVKVVILAFTVTPLLAELLLGELGQPQLHRDRLRGRRSRSRG